jgi:ABC-type polysaccharide/polyol phosphate export permease
MLVNLLPAFGKNLLREKYWKTLPSLFISPVNINNLLVSKIVSELIIFIIPLTIILILCFIIAEASVISIIFVLLIYVLAALFMGSIGLAIGSFRMSIEGGYRFFFLIINIFLIFSCYKYPREFFPDYLQFFIIWNPFYYYWDLIRVILVLGFENVIFNLSYVIHFMVVISFSIMGPIFSISFFNYIYKKYGLVGY